jgi:hypothetical protein
MAATVVVAGVLLAPTLTASADAAVSNTGKSTTGGSTTAGAHLAPGATSGPTCLTGEANSYEFYTWCQGTSPASYRTIAYCADGQAVLGAEYADGSGSLSYADCSSNDLNSTLVGTSGNPVGWGILWCSNDNGTGTYAGYYDTKNDISLILANWGAGNITNGGTTLCQYSIGPTTTAISPTTPA